MDINLDVKKTHWRLPDLQRKESLSGYAFISGAVGLRFISRAGQLETVLPTARYRCNISSKGAVLPGRNDAQIGPVNSLQASALYCIANFTNDFI